MCVYTHARVYNKTHDGRDAVDTVYFYGAARREIGTRVKSIFYLNAMKHICNILKVSRLISKQDIYLCHGTSFVSLAHFSDIYYRLSFIQM